MRAMLPDGVSLALWGVDVCTIDMSVHELELVSRATEGRATEFARGRSCARAALALLGADAPSIPTRPGGAPDWPPGFVGSITHCHGLVAAVAARRDRFWAVGLDAETGSSLPKEVVDYVLIGAERRLVKVPPLDLVVFSAKESIYKALNPELGEWIDFSDVEVTLDPDSGSFAARAVTQGKPLSPLLATLRGRFVVLANHVATATWRPTSFE